MADSHYHPCPQCGGAAECLLEIGNPACGKVSCADCSALSMGTPPYCGVPSEKHFYCTLSKGHGGSWHVAHRSPTGEIERWPMAPTEAISLEPDPSATVDDKKAYECPCGSEYTDPSEITVCQAKDCQEKICEDCQVTCEKCNKDVCENCSFSCNDCSNNYCNSHSFRCCCCEVDLCLSCSEEHGVHPKET